MRALQMETAWGEPLVKNVQARMPGPGEAMARIDSAYVGTRERSSASGNRDVYYPGHTRKFPLTLGYQAGATVTEVGEGCRIAPGTRVFVNGFAECRRCHQCLNGNMGQCPNHDLLGLDVHGCIAEFVTAPELCFFPVPPEIPTDAIAGASEVSTALRGLKRAGSIAGRKVAAIGCGDIGITIAILLRLSAVSSLTVIDPSERARDLARRFVPDAEILAPEEVDDRLFDTTFESSNAEAGIELAIKSLAPNGTAVIYSALGPATFRFEVLYKQWHEKEITIRMSNAKNPEDVREAINLLAARPILQSLFELEVVPFDEAGTVLKEILSGARHRPVCVHPHDL
jgi:threonine dehydrogenase-like Zn-dependent dehydrogenase